MHLLTNLISKDLSKNMFVAFISEVFYIFFIFLYFYIYANDNWKVPQIHVPVCYSVFLLDREI